MASRGFVRWQVIGGTILGVIALVAFNASRPLPETEVQAAFTGWYRGASQYLESTTDPKAGSRKIIARVKLMAPLKSPDSLASSTPQAESPRTETSEWVIPVPTGDINEQRSRLARVLQLINEARVYDRHSYLSPPAGSTPYLSIIVSEDANIFEANVPVADVEKSIQIKNLIKLLEVFGASSVPAPQINPGRL